MVLLDSDEEKDSKADVQSDLNRNQTNGTGEKEKSGSKDEDIVMEYNHSEYADLVGPMKPNNMIQKPAPNNQPQRLPKKPGNLPPFALFSQEMRDKLQKDDPNIGFGDLGRKLGEMWHALQEEEKEEYRVRARKVVDERMNAWRAQMNAITPQKRKMLESQQRMQMNKVKKKRTSGYSIFCSEYRRKLSQEQPDLSFADISKTVADDWRDLTQEKKNSYEIRAQRFNQEEEKRWRARMASQQQSQMRMRQQMTMGRGRGVGTMIRGRGGQFVGRGGGTAFRNILPKTSPNNAGSGLVISSVSSLSTNSSQNNLNLPIGISISKSADPDINLPKSISISRVEPDIQIVEESIQSRPVQQQQRSVAPVMMSRGRGQYSVRSRAGHVRPNIAPRGRGMVNTRGRMMINHQRGRPIGAGVRGGVMSSRGRGISAASPVKIIQHPLPAGASPMKRMASNLVSPIGPLKRPRMPFPPSIPNASNIPGKMKFV